MPSKTDGRSTKPPASGVNIGIAPLIQPSDALGMPEYRSIADFRSLKAEYLLSAVCSHGRSLSLNSSNCDTSTPADARPIDAPLGPPAWKRALRVWATSSAVTAGGGGGGG